MDETWKTTQSYQNVIILFDVAFNLIDLINGVPVYKLNMQRKLSLTLYDI